MINQYDIYLISLDPTLGREMKKTRPCIVISPNEMNHHIGTVIIAPMTTRSKNYPTRISITSQGKSGWIVLDQIRSVEKARLRKRLGKVDSRTVSRIKSVVKEMLVD